MNHLMQENSCLSLTKIFTFDTAHALENYPGKCRAIHGHTYTLYVTVIGRIRNEPGHPFDGMIIDFTDLKAWVNESVIRHFDHFLLLKEGSQLAKLNYPEWDRIYLTPYQPSCENMLLDISHRLQMTVPEGLKINRLRLFETPTSFAEWENAN